MIGSFYSLTEYEDEDEDEDEYEDGETSLAQILGSESKSLTHKSREEPGTCRGKCNWEKNGEDVTRWIRINK